MASFTELKTLIYTGLARDDTDPAAVRIVPYALNWAIKVAGILFKPVELATVSSLTILAGTSYKAFDTNFIDIQSVVNPATWKDLHFVPYESFRIIAPTSTTNPIYYTLFGNIIIVSGVVASNLLLNIYWLKLPSEEMIEFTGYDGFIVSLASAIAFAMFEEGETVDMWTKMSEILGMSAMQRTKMQEVMQGIPASLEAQLTGTLAGSK